MCKHVRVRNTKLRKKNNINNLLQKPNGHLIRTWKNKNIIINYDYSNNLELLIARVRDIKAVQ